MHGAHLHIGGTAAIADPAGALYLPDHRALLVADLHLEKASAFAASGTMLPPYDSRQTLTLLDRLVRHYAPQAVYCLGDSFHDGDGPRRLDAVDGARLAKLTSGRRWIWIAGNHDGDAGLAWGGEAAVEIELGRLVLRHAATEGLDPIAEVSGHFHPKAAVRTRGRTITGRCFVTDGRRLILPALGAFAGGLDVTDPAIASLMAPRFQVFLMGRHRLAVFSRAQLLPPR
ncbi:MAG: ligase-associated DNA damage response endonuclease PdeM [Alphaproteobacteria bacterium]|nr:ligase-associated DNA damage response endonuclease PdeM [Alphaproteobacteria bacterium]